MKTAEFTITTRWHKATDRWAITYKQLKYIDSLRTDENCPEWPFNSTSNAMRSLTKEDGSEIIEALKNGDRVIFE